MKFATPSDFLKWNTAIGRCRAFAIGCSDNEGCSVFGISAFRENAPAFQENAFTFYEILRASAGNAPAISDAVSTSPELLSASSAYCFASGGNAHISSSD